MKYYGKFNVNTGELALVMRCAEEQAQAQAVLGFSVSESKYPLNSSEDWRNPATGEFESRPDMGLTVSGVGSIADPLQISGEPIGCEIWWPDDPGYTDVSDGSGISFSAGESGIYFLRLRLFPYKEVEIKCQID